jgi:hypothetical protein
MVEVIAVFYASRRGNSTSIRDVSRTKDRVDSHKVYGEHSSKKLNTRSLNVVDLHNNEV